ncbi:CYTH domain-containing protein [Rhodococcus globerulus]|uniref:CYTH domain-containing protein n=1 Tax=Rhodococcus globerulus TaxID=33008 RepID=UPI00374F06E6
MVPDLAKVLPADGRIEQTTVDLDSVYYDTADQNLLHHGVTLRRRSGGADAGWHLNVPAYKARTEIRLPPDVGDSVPAELADLVAGVALGEPLHPVAMISTARHHHRRYRCGQSVKAALRYTRVMLHRSLARSTSLSATYLRSPFSTAEFGRATSRAVTNPRGDQWL